MSDTGDFFASSIGQGLEEKPPFFAQVLENIPSITTSTLWNTGRVKNTLLGGSKVYRAEASSIRRALGTGKYSPPGMKRMFGGIFREEAGTGGLLKQGFSNTFRPSRFRRFTRAAAIDPSNYAKEAKMYTPFGGLAHIGNAIADRDLSKLPFIGGRLKSTGPRIAGDVESMPAFSAGTLGRMVTNSELAGMSGRALGKFERKGAAALAHSLNDINAGVGSKYTAASFLDAAGGANTLAARQAITNSVRSRVSGRVMGFMDAATEMGRARSLLGAGTGAEQAAARYYMKGLTNPAAIAGAEKAVASFGAEGAMGAVTRFAPIAAKGMKFLPVIGNALMIRDAIKITGAAVGGLVKTGMEAAQSIKGSIDRPLFGMGYRDNEVASTSRQRGVMAIQNSQLNARSMLGSEAAGLHAHFG